MTVRIGASAPGITLSSWRVIAMGGLVTNHQECFAWLRGDGRPAAQGPALEQKLWRGLSFVVTATHRNLLRRRSHRVGTTRSRRPVATSDSGLRAIHVRLARVSPRRAAQTGELQESVVPEAAGLEPVAARDEHHDCDVERRNVLRYDRLRSAVRKTSKRPTAKREQFAVALAGPAHLWRCPRLVTDELAFQAPRKALVKQDAHGRGAPPWPAPRPPRPAPG